MVTTCEFPPCDREPVAKGLCIVHYTQQHHGRPLKPIRKKRMTVNGYKECAMCEVSKPMEDYYQYNGYPLAYCKPCMLMRSKAQQARERAQRQAERAGSNSVGQSPTQLNQEES